jgi:hypothetical protein
MWFGGSGLRAVQFNPILTNYPEWTSNFTGLRVQSHKNTFTHAQAVPTLSNLTIKFWVPTILLWFDKSLKLLRELRTTHLPVNKLVQRVQLKKSQEEIQCEIPRSVQACHPPSHLHVFISSNTLWILILFVTKLSLLRQDLLSFYLLVIGLNL